MTGCSFSRVLVTACLVAALTPLSDRSAVASINLELRPGAQAVTVGNSFSVDLYAVSDNPIANQSLSAIQMILSWDTAFVQFSAVDNTGSPLFSSAFIPGDPFGLNASLTDGDGLWNGFASPGVPVQATPAGTFLTRFNFSALNVTAPSTLINIPATGGSGGQTIVYDGVTPNTNVTGTLTGATITINPVPGAGGLSLMMVGLLGSGRRRRD